MLAFPVIHALDEGYDVYFVTDASGGTSVESHEMGIQRMIQAGAVPLTSVVFMSELQRDWARMETAGKVGEILLDHGGASGTSLAWELQLLAGRGGVGVYDVDQVQVAPRGAVAPIGATPRSAAYLSIEFRREARVGTRVRLNAGEGRGGETPSESPSRPVFFAGDPACWTLLPTFRNCRTRSSRLFDYLASKGDGTLRGSARNWNAPQNSGASDA